MRRTSVAVAETLDETALLRAVDVIDRARKAGCTVWIVGNGGSATTASHLATDLQKRTGGDGIHPVRAISLADNVGLLTAWANDSSVKAMFAEQVNALGRPGDVLIAISASGNSPNIVSAVRAAKDLGLTVVGLSGFAGGELRDLSDVALHAPVASYEIAEDVHLAMCHLLVICLMPEFSAPSLTA